MKTKEGRVRPVIISILWSIFILVFYTLGGIITQVNQMNEVNTKIVNGVCIWGSVIVACCFIWKKKKFTEMGFRKIQTNAQSNVMYYIPAIILEATGFYVGLRELNVKYILALIILTIAVGFAEEIYFRSIILDTLRVFGVKKAIIISSILFGITHIGNVIGGADIVYTLIQIAFAFIFGIVFAELFIITKSLIPVIIWHALHDFFCYIQKEPDMKTIVLFSGIQTLLLLFYAIYMWRKLDKIIESEHTVV